eukprot:Em0110g14a
MEDYSAASDCIDRVLEIEPSNSQAKQVKALISKKQFRDTLLGYGILGGAAVAGAAVAVGAAAPPGPGVVTETLRAHTHQPRHACRPFLCHPIVGTVNSLVST